MMMARGLGLEMSLDPTTEWVEQLRCRSLCLATLRAPEYSYKSPSPFFLVEVTGATLTPSPR